MQVSSQCFDEGQDLLAHRAIAAALHCFDQAEQQGYSLAECCGARWQGWMLLGRFDQAWQESERIIVSGAFDPHRLWNGSGWERKRVMLRCLHGLGDTIQFIRYAPRLRNSCASLVVQTHPELVRLLKCVAGVTEVTSWGSGWEGTELPWDLQMEVTELPFAFRSTVATIPKCIPYIRLPEDQLRWASGLIANSTSRLRVGVIWQAGPFDSSRSAGPDLAQKLSEVVGCDVYSLQKDAEPAPQNTIDLACHVTDVLDTAALMAQLDLIVSVDSMTAHLAGALGKPVWILLPFTADWRWMIDRKDSPWYPSAHLFRQTEPGNWITVMIAVKNALRQLVASKQP